MVSTEDPPCSCEISPSKSIRNRDQRDYDNQQLLEVDLHRSFPQFSMRDYVFNTRSNHIKTNWPFSQESLKFCLKHGVANLLPPFQSIDSVRNQSVKKCVVESISSEKENTSSYNTGLHGSSHHLVSASSDNVECCNQKQEVDCENVNSHGSKEDKKYPLTTAGQSCFGTDSVSTEKSSCLEPKAKNLPGPLVGKLNSASISNQVGNTIHKLVKKCRLIVKLSNTTANALEVLETMSSHVCPVCMTFSSSSNTTLNAHIDQCLFEESTNKWADNYKVIKHRIKPRKIRLMEDIYATAQHCTLEELDRRNGTNWASNLGFVSQGTEMCTEEKNKTSSPVNFDGTNEKDAVYIDSYGTKLRILCSDLAQNSNARNDFGPENNKTSSAVNFEKTKIKDGQQRRFPPEESCQKDESPAEPLNVHCRMKFNKLGITKHWLGSKKTGLTKTMKPNDKNQPSDIDVQKDIRVKSTQSSQISLFEKKSSDLNCLVSCDKSMLSPPGRSSRNEILSCDSHDECNEQPSLRKRGGYSLELRNCHKKKLLVSPKSNAKKLRKDSLLVHDRYTNPSCDPENLVCSKFKKRMKVNIGLDKNVSSSFISSRTASSHVLSSGEKKFSSLRKDLLSVGQAPFPESKTNTRSKYLDLKKPRVHCISGSDEEAVASQFANDRQHNLVERPSESVARSGKTLDDISFDRTGVLKTGKRKRETILFGKEEAMILESSKPSHESDCVPPLASDTLEPAEREVEYLSDFVCKPTTEMSNEEVFTVFSTSADRAFPCGRGPNVQHVLQQNLDSLKERYPVEPVLGSKRDIFWAAEVGKDMNGHDAQMLAKFDIEGKGNYFVDVDRILIPGPPGSFLPSPGRMGSEDFQGNSSITNSRFQSSEDEHELVDMVSSDSPPSMISAVSNSIPARSNAMSLEKLSVGPFAVQHETGSGLSGASFDPILECFTTIEQAVRAGEGKLDLLFPETSPLKFMSNQSCCPKEEGAPQTFGLDYQESQPLWKRAMASLPLPVLRRKMSDDLNEKLDGFNLSSETASMNKPSPKPRQYVAESPAGHILVEVSDKTEVKIPTRGACLCTSATTSPVLRLMGKNLMVVNKNEDLCPHTTPAQSSMQYHVDNVGYHSSSCGFSRSNHL